MKNVGTADRITRIVVGLLLLWLGYAQLSGTWVWVSYVVGAIMILVGIFSYCPLYKLFGVNTCKTCGMAESKEETPAQQAPTEQQEQPSQAQPEQSSAPAQERPIPESQPQTEPQQPEMPHDDNNQVNM